MLKDLWRRITNQEPPKKTRKKREKQPAFAQPDLYLAKTVEDQGAAMTNHHERIGELERGLEALREEVRNYKNNTVGQ
jgi:hypothetical protein